MNDSCEYDQSDSGVSCPPGGVRVTNAAIDSLTNKFTHATRLNSEDDDQENDERYQFGEEDTPPIKKMRRLRPFTELSLQPTSTAAASSSGSSSLIRTPTKSEHKSNDFQKGDGGSSKRVKVTPVRSIFSLASPVPSPSIASLSPPAPSLPTPPANVTKKPPSASIAHYNMLVRSAKQYEQEEDWKAALKAYEEAGAIRQSDTLDKKIRILTRRCAKIDAEAKAEAKAKDDAEAAEAAAAAEAEAEAAAEKSEDERELCDFRIVHDGKFAWDQDKKIHYILTDDGKSSASAIRTTIPSDSPRISKFSIPSPIFDQIYPYQRDSLIWMWGLHTMNAGGVLGDDMGLGKTVQVACYLAGLFFSRQCKRVLLVAPLSVLGQWERELQKWCGAGSKKAGGLRVILLTSTGSKSKRDSTEAELFDLMNNPKSSGIVLTTYGLLASRAELFNAKGFQHHAINEWDYGILDEGHKIKNPDTILSKVLHDLPIAHKLLLTGTPILNDLEELWSLFNWTSSGTLLGARSNFRNEFSKKIMAGIAKSAKEAEKRLSEALTIELRKRIEPFFLRREKRILLEMKDNKPRDDDDDFGQKEGDAGSEEGAIQASSIPRSVSAPASSSSSSSAAMIGPRLTVQKNDLILWVHMSPLQVLLYSAFLSSDKIKSIFTNQTRSPLVALSVLKKICDHPRLLTEEMKLTEDIGEEVGKLPPLPGAATAIALKQSVQFLTQESSKMRILEQLLESHIADGHRTLVFSQSRKMLTMITMIVEQHGWKFLRIDGAVSDHVERQKRMDKFNKDPSYQVFILTTRAGGVGMNLVGANRVIIFDPDWTPSLDNQAVDRAYRLGQTRNVVVYRFITCGTVEEVIYRKQVFKGSLIRAATAAGPGGDPSSSSSSSSSTTAPSKEVTRYFSAQELREVFQFSNPYHSATHDQLLQLHPPKLQRKTYPELENHLVVVHKFQAIHGITDHDLLFQDVATTPSVDYRAAMLPDPSSTSSTSTLTGADHRLSPSELAQRAIETLEATSAVRHAPSYPPVGAAGSVTPPRRHRKPPSAPGSTPIDLTQVYSPGAASSSPSTPVPVTPIVVIEPYTPSSAHLVSRPTPPTPKSVPKRSPSPHVPIPFSPVAVPSTPPTPAVSSSPPPTYSPPPIGTPASPPRAVIDLAHSSNDDSSSDESDSTLDPSQFISPPMKAPISAPPSPIPASVPVYGSGPSLSVASADGEPDDINATVNYSSVKIERDGEEKQAEPSQNEDKSAPVLDMVPASIDDDTNATLGYAAPMVAEVDVKDEEEKQNDWISHSSDLTVEDINATLGYGTAMGSDKLVINAVEEKEAAVKHEPGEHVHSIETLPSPHTIVSDLNATAGYAHESNEKVTDFKDESKEWIRADRSPSVFNSTMKDSIPSDYHPPESKASPSISKNSMGHSTHLFPILHPLSSLTPTETHRYRELIQRASEFSESSTCPLHPHAAATTPQLLHQLSLLLEACQLCDEDINLQVKIMELGEQLVMLK